ncbi:succinylglutamate desuccinylase/aspartoacylase family protein [Aquabacterium sp. OR-4]|uniref:succinylglutamate desuccinylase/aspartoacylase family protein n=1 Tax=Aquabacterium sp. OR-4 TaxID=2978127 RepID=UPI0021B3016A|nr:succinylglutamate desuccinylase/aspartoacylase family protein [Aquabacterium sp. OR-4]MDT7833721.1 M14 family metallopeptidase [Aquabacterium sp. OR-4]
MLTIQHPLLPAVPGTTRSLTSLHYGTPGSGPKVLIQASLHADEVPGMLVAHHLRQRLGALESAGRLRGEVVLVPAANPIGIGQWTLRSHQGRFELASGENFNRAYADLAPAVAEAVRGQLGADAAANVARVRAALRAAVAALPAASELQSLRKALFGLAVDADVVLDLHCDGEGVLHFYTTPDCWPGLQPLARCMGAQAVLLAEQSGGEPFDEALSMPWALLARQFGPATPLPQACLAVTIELRGEADVAHPLAAQDAAAIEQFLALRGLVADAPSDAAALPPLRCEATPLAGSMPLVAPHGGVIVFVRAPGERVTAGDTIAELIDPFTGALTPLKTPVDGLFFARENRRFAVAGMSVGKVAGAQAQREGALLSP